MQVSGILDISMTVRTSEQNALLFAVSANIENFLAIDIFNGVVRLRSFGGFDELFFVFCLFTLFDRFVLLLRSSSLFP